MKTREQVLAKLAELPDHNWTTPEEALQWVLAPPLPTGTIVTYHMGDYSNGSWIESDDGFAPSTCMVRSLYSGFRLLAVISTKIADGGAPVDVVYFKRLASRKPYYPRKGEKFEFIGEYDEN